MSNNKLVARVAIVGTLACALAVGVGLYYSQIYAYYETLAIDDLLPVKLKTLDGTFEEVKVADPQGIDSPSSPVRFRACFVMEEPVEGLAAKFVPYEGAEPLVGPDWFDCFDAKELGKAIEEGVAQTYLWQESVHYGIDRLLTVMPDGRAFSWNQINSCGKVVYDGKPAPEGCPEAPEL